MMASSHEFQTNETAFELQAAGRSALDSLVNLEESSNSADSKNQINPTTHMKTQLCASWLEAPKPR